MGSDERESFGLGETGVDRADLLSAASKSRGSIGYHQLVPKNV